MRHLNYLEKLLDGVEVKWTALEKVADIYDSLHKTPQYSETGFNMIRVTDIKGEYVNLDQTLKVNDEVFVDFTKKYLPVKDDLVMSRVGSYGNVGIIPTDNIACMGQNTVVIHPLINSKFIFYILGSNIGQNFIERNVEGGNQKTLSLKSIKAIPIPIPCTDNPEKSLALQAEIVRILDAFTAMTAELTAELSMRKKQYNYYREKLLASELSSSKISTLGEILDMRAGKHIKAKDISAIKNTEHKYNCFGGNGSRGFVQEYSHEGNYALIGRQGALCGNVKRAEGKFYATEHAVVCTPKEEIDIDWAFHMLTFMNLNQYKSQSAQPGLAVGNLANLTINVPSISEQKKIAKILNKFDTLTSSISEGLPREIELRHKQYEYYRDLLLSFPKPEIMEGA